MRPRSVLHVADVHVGLGGRGAEGCEAAAFSGAIDFAIAADVDAVVIAGDLFDHPRVPESVLEWAAAELDRARRPAVLLPGNHDALHEGSVHDRFEVEQRCDAVQLLDDPEGSMVDVPGTDIVVWGRGMVDHTPEFRPLAGVPAKPPGKWGVVAGHGLVHEEGARRHHSSPITEADLDVGGWDYIALGHHHRYKVVRSHPTPVVYPGLTVRSCDGRPGAVLVRFDPSDGTSFEWVDLGVSGGEVRVPSEVSQGR